MWEPTGAAKSASPAARPATASSATPEQQKARGFLSPAELSTRYRGTISVKTLRNWRSAKCGPKFTKLGRRVVYHSTDVLAWEEERRVAGKEMRADG